MYAFIDTHDGTDEYPDPEGIALEDMAAVTALVTSTLAELARDKPAGTTVRVTARGETGILCSASLTVEQASAADQPVVAAIEAINRGSRSAP